jgi:hypothetical protein
MTADELYDVLLAATGRFEEKTGAYRLWELTRSGFPSPYAAERVYLEALAQELARRWPGEKWEAEDKARRQERGRVRVLLREAGMALAREAQEGRALPPSEVLARLLGAIPD